MIAYVCHKCGAPLESADADEGGMDTCPVCGVACPVPYKPILYKCPSCHAKLESPADLGGRTDVCPHCERTIPVPKSKHQIEEEKQWLRTQAERQKLAKRKEKAKEAEAQLLMTPQTAERTREGKGQSERRRFAHLVVLSVAFCGTAVSGIALAIFIVFEIYADHAKAEPPVASTPQQAQTQAGSLSSVTMAPHQPAQTPVAPALSMREDVQHGHVPVRLDDGSPNGVFDVRSSVIIIRNEQPSPIRILGVTFNGEYQARIAAMEELSAVYPGGKIIQYGPYAPTPYGPSDPNPEIPSGSGREYGISRIATYPVDLTIGQSLIVFHESSVFLLSDSGKTKGYEKDVLFIDVVTDSGTIRLKP